MPRRELTITYPNGDEWTVDAHEVALMWAEETAKEMKNREDLTPRDYLIRLRGLFDSAVMFNSDELFEYIKRSDFTDLNPIRVEKDLNNRYYWAQLKNASIEWGGLRNE